MHQSAYRWKLIAFVVGLLLVSNGSAWSSRNSKVLLKNVQTLTLRGDRKTTHRRVSAVPQLKCVGGNGCRFHKVDVMRCENAGADYDEGSIQWTCKADIPDYFKLGSTEVKCEGYTSPTDPYILKGSCGVEYRLLLTEKGEARYGYSSFSSSTEESSTFFKLLFWALFLGVAFWIIRAAIRSRHNGNNNNFQGPRRPPFDGRGGGDGGGGGGGGGWFGGGDDRPNDPPPPYSQFPSRKRPTQHQHAHAANEGWRPGFWSGVLGGGAGGYWLGSRNNERERRRGGNFYNNYSNNGFGGGGHGRNTGYNSNNDPGEGSSTGGSYYSSTGFGGTSNR